MALFTRPSNPIPESAKRVTGNCARRYVDRLDAQPKKATYSNLAMRSELLDKLNEGVFQIEDGCVCTKGTQKVAFVCIFMNHEERIPLNFILALPSQAPS